MERREVVHGDDAAARPVGGTTKFVPCTTSTSPMNHSNRGRLLRAHIAWSGRAGIGRWCAATPAGRWSPMRRRRRQLTA